MTEENFHGRVSVLEHGLNGLEKRVEAGFVDVGRAISKLTETLGSRRESIPFKEIISSVVATLTVVAFVATFANYWVHQSNAVMEYRLQQSEMRLDAIGGLMSRVITPQFQLQK